MGISEEERISSIGLIMKRNKFLKKHGKWLNMTYGSINGKKSRIHGESHPPTHEYISWYSMKTRCNNKKDEHYKLYGKRGIKVCDRWQEPNGKGYMNFLDDMGRKPNAEHSLDRINNDGNYEPSNCRWADKSTQAKNRRERKRNKYGLFV